MLLSIHGLFRFLSRRVSNGAHLFARVEIVLLLRFVAGNVGVNTLASKRSKLLGDADIHNDSTCVCLRIPVAAITQKRNNASVDLWPA